MKKEMEVGGVVTSEVLKQNLQGRMEYDLVIHYFYVSTLHLLPGKKSVSLVDKDLLLEEKFGIQSSISVHDLLNNAFMRRFLDKFDNLMHKCTFVTGCANTMPCIVGCSSTVGRWNFRVFGSVISPTNLNPVLKKPFQNTE